MDEVPDTPAKPWYDPGLRFTCTQCGDCCTGAPGYVWFDDDEAKAMADRKGVSLAEFYDRFATKKVGRWTLGEVRRGGKYDCVFLERDGDAGGPGRCGIYEVRPTQCRTWPFWGSNVKSPKAWKAAAKHCPGMQNGLAGEGTFIPIERITEQLAKNPRGL